MSHKAIYLRVEYRRKKYIRTFANHRVVDDLRHKI